MAQTTENIVKDTKHLNGTYKKSSKKRKRKMKRGAKILASILIVLLLLIGTAFVYFIKGGDFSFIQNFSFGKDASKVTTEDTFTPEHSDALDVSLPQAEVSLTISVVGDCTLGTDENFNYARSLNKYYENHGAAYFLKNVKSIFESDDLTIANLEGTFTNSTSRVDKTYAFKGPAEFVNILTKGSVEAVTVANNHSRDYGTQSLTDTKNTLDSAGVVHFGYDETAVMDVKGVKVGLVGIYELIDHTGRAQQVKDNIAKVKADGAEIVIVIFHWGIERDAAPNSHQTYLARLAIDEGADLVCGHHPHVLQGIETYKGKNIVYSLGNFCFGGNSNPSDKDTMIFQQTFTITKDGVKADNVTNIIPCSLSSVKTLNDYCPTPATGSEAERILQKIKDRSSLIQTP